MSDAWMIPNIPAMGGGGIFSTGSSGLGSAYQQALANQAYYAQQQAALQAAQVSQQQLYGAGGFGGDTARYAALGAAYGRGTGGFGGYSGGNTDPMTPYDPNAARAAAYASNPALRGPTAAPTPVPVASSPFDVENAGGVPYLGSGGGDPMGGGGFGSYVPPAPAAVDPNAARAAAYASNPALRGPMAAPAPMAPQAPFNDYGGGANPGSFSPSPNYPGSSPSQPFDPNAARAAAYASNPALRGPMAAPAPTPTPSPPPPPITPTGGSPGPMPTQPSTAVDPNAARAAAYAANPALRGPGAGMSSIFDQSIYRSYDPNSFANRFGAGGYYQPGTPSQYYTGSQYPGAQAPPAGYQTPFSADNPDGALPVDYYQHAFTPSAGGA